MFKGKKKPFYVMNPVEREKVRSLMKRLEAASEEIVSAKAVLSAMLHGTIQTRGIRSEEYEIVFNFDDFAFHPGESKKQPGEPAH